MKHVNLSGILGIILISMTLFTSIKCRRRQGDILLTLKEKNEKLEKRINHLKYEKKRSEILRKLNRSGIMRKDSGLNSRKRKFFKKRSKQRSRRKYRSRPQKSKRIQMGFIQNLVPNTGRNVNAEILPKRTQNSYMSRMRGQYPQNSFTQYQPNMFNPRMNQNYQINPNYQNYQYRSPTHMNNALRNGEYSFKQSRVSQKSPVMGGTLFNNHLQVTPIMNTVLPNDRNQMIDRRQSFQDNMQDIANQKMQNVILNERKFVFKLIFSCCY